LAADSGEAEVQLHPQEAREPHGRNQAHDEHRPRKALSLARPNQEEQKKKAQIALVLTLGGDVLERKLSKGLHAPGAVASARRKQPANQWQLLS